MKTLFLILFLIPLNVLAESLHCTSDLTTESIPFKIGEFQTEVTNFQSNLAFTQNIEGTDFSYTIVTGLTNDIMDDPDHPIFVGKPTLISLVIFNSSKSQIARFDSYPLEAMRIINLTAGSALASASFRIHVACYLK